MSPKSKKAKELIKNKELKQLAIIIEQVPK